MWPFGKRQEQPAPERERAIFKYWDGETERHADPLMIHREFYGATSIDHARDLPRCVGMDADGNEVDIDPDSQVRVTRLIRKVFDIKPFREGGLTEFELFDLLGEFVAYIERLKKNAAPMRTPSPRLASQFSATKPEQTTSGEPA